MSHPRKLVVAGLVLSEARDRVLITQRRPDQEMGGQWEFPGGKVEPGESPSRALARELDEEIAVGVQVGQIWEVLHHIYPAFELVLLVYPCWVSDGREPTPHEVSELAWCRPEELAGYSILSADQPLISRLAREGLPKI